MIGASTFNEDGPEALAAPEGDVEALRNILLDEKIAGFRPKNIKFALNERLERTRELVYWLFNDRKKDDLLLLYYTGHGIKDPRDGRLYLALAGTKKKKPWPNSIDASVIQHQIKLSNSDRKVVILDCCFSGAIGDSGAVLKSSETAAVEQDTFSPRGYGSITLASSSATQNSYEHEDESIYTRFLVDALRTGAADPAENEISAHALHKYLYKQVTKKARELGGLMEPVIYSAEKAPLIIARNPNPRRPLDKEILEDLWSDDDKRVELATIHLGEIMESANKFLTRRARTELTNRLETAGNLRYRVVQRIETVLSQNASPPPAQSVESEREANERAEDERLPAVSERKVKEKKRRLVEEKVRSRTATEAPLQRAESKPKPGPRVRVEFVLDDNGIPTRVPWYGKYRFAARFFIDGAPENAVSATYLLHHSHSPPRKTVSAGENRSFEMSMYCYGNFRLRAIVGDTDAIDSLVSEALRETYCGNMTDPIKRAIERIEEN